MKERVRTEILILLEVSNVNNDTLFREIIRVADRRQNAQEQPTGAIGPLSEMDMCELPATTDVARKPKPDEVTAACCIQAPFLVAYMKRP